MLFAAFGLGTMIYNGLEFGTFFELPLESPCYLILKGVNPVLQMVFTFMQMYFIFMNSRVSIQDYLNNINFQFIHDTLKNFFFLVKYPSIQGYRPFWFNACCCYQHLRMDTDPGTRIFEGNHWLSREKSSRSTWRRRAWKWVFWLCSFKYSLIFYLCFWLVTLLTFAQKLSVNIP